MPRLLKADLEHDGIAFVPKSVSDPRFQAEGVAWGSSRDCWWAVVDPEAHPLYIWRKSGRGITAYGRTALSCNATVFTNGPMMGKRYSPARKVTKRSVVWEFARWASAGAIGGLAAGSVLQSRRAYGIGCIAATGLGVANAWRNTFTNWVPCGTVRSRNSAVHDRQDFDNEGRTHSWFGRFSTDFASYGIGQGDLPAGVLEGLGGLIRLISDFSVASKRPGDVAFNGDFAQLSQKKGIAAWGLIPLNGHLDTSSASSAAGGVIIVIASRNINAEEAADRLCRIGTRDAVAMDQSGCTMMGIQQQFMVGPPPPHRQAMQLYGLSCK
ncbi:MAG: hypothetical protein ABI670_21790 [Chloroflexota bacterium]